MKIWLVSIGEPLPIDEGERRILRTGMIAEILCERGHDVTFWGSTLDHVRKKVRASATTERQIPGGYKVVLLHGRPYRKSVSIRRVIHNRGIAVEFRKKARREELPDVILSCMPPIEISLEAVKFGVENNVPVALDIRDMWPDIFLDVGPDWFRPIARLMLEPVYRQFSEAVRDASSVLGITQAMIEWASGTANRRVREGDRAFFHAYKRRTIDEPRLEEARDYWASCGIHGNEKQFIASFIGSLSNRLELRTLIKAAQAIGPQYRDKIRIVICGSGNDQKNLEAEAAGLPHVQFAGWIDRFKIEALLERSSIGLLPYPSSRDFIRSIPNKVGEYLSRGVPILSSVQGVSEELIGKGHCGKTYPNNDHDALAQLLIQLSEDGERVSAMSKNAATVFDKYLDADKVYGEFCDYLEGLALSRR